MQYDCCVMLEEIQKKREKMIETANMKGFTDDDTIRHSQELDQLIYEYQRFTKESNRKEEDSKVILQQMILILPQLNLLV